MLRVVDIVGDGRTVRDGSVVVDVLCETFEGVSQHMRARVDTVYIETRMRDMLQRVYDSRKDVRRSLDLCAPCQHARRVQL